jgi:hypothetical protein
MLDDQQPQDHFNRRRWPPGLGRVWSPLAQISFDVLKDLVIFEQPIEFCQLGLEPQLKRGYQRVQVD